MVRSIGSAGHDRCAGGHKIAHFRETSARARLQAFLSLAVVTATDLHSARSQPSCCPWLPDQGLVPPQRRALPCAVHAAAPGGHSLTIGIVLVSREARQRLDLPRPRSRPALNGPILLPRPLHVRRRRRPIDTRSARCGHRSSPGAGTYRGTPRCSLDLLDRFASNSRSARRSVAICCARAASGQAAAAPPRSVMKSRRLIASPPAGYSLTYIPQTET
jgi:hypothetical protein